MIDVYYCLFLVLKQFGSKQAFVQDQFYQWNFYGVRICLSVYVIDFNFDIRDVLCT